MKSNRNVAVLSLVILSLSLYTHAQLQSKQLVPSSPGSPSSASVEDFSVASLAASKLQADPPEIVERSEGPGFVREFVTVKWRPGDDIYLYVVRPKDVPKPPVVIYLYGHPSETDRYQDDGWCQRVTAGGYAAAGFVPALTGHRYHNRPMKEWFVSELQESLGKSTHDVQMVLNYLAQRGDVDMDRVGMFGVGAGATIGVIASSVDSRIKALDLLDPWGDWPRWMEKSEVIPDDERPNYVKLEFLKNVAQFDPVALLPKVKAPRVRLIQVTEDTDATPEEAKKRMELALPATGETQRYESNVAYHGAIASGGRAFDWMKAQLKTQSNAGRSADAGRSTALSAR